MIPRKGLAEWLRDEAAQVASAARTEACARQLRDLPALDHLRHALEEAEEGGADSILAAARHFLDRSDGIGSCLDVLIEAARADPFFRPPLRTISSPVHSGLVLVDRPQLTLFVSVAGPDAMAAKRRSRSGAGSIAFPGQRCLYKVMRAGGATLSFWEAPEIRPSFTAVGSGRCRLAERRRMAEGEIFELDGRRQSFVVEHLESDFVYVQAQTPVGAAPLMAEYDSDTLEFVGASSTDDVGSRIQMMLSLLRIMDRQDAAPLFRQLLDSPHFYARWHVMREFLALDAELALPHLREMARADAHPEVRAAAAQTLAAFFPEPEEMATCPA